MANIQQKKLTLNFVAFIVFWLLYPVIYDIIKNNPVTTNISGFLPLLCLATLDITIIVYATELGRKNFAKKTIFHFFAIAFLFSFTDDVLYNLNANILHNLPKSVPSWIDIADNIAFLGHLLFTTLIWFNIFYNYVKQNKRKKFYLPCVSLLTALFLIFSIAKWQNNQLLINNIFNTSELFLCFIGFMLAIFCLTTSKSKGIFYTALAFSISRFSDFILSYGICSQQYAIGSTLETSWIIVLLFYVYGMSQFKTENFRLEKELALSANEQRR